MKYLFALILAPIVLSSCAHGEYEIKTEYYEGQIQRSSLDGAQKYGPAFKSLVKREINSETGVITECVFQEGRGFVNLLRRIENSRVYKLEDLGGYSEGRVIMGDDEGRTWSYDIKVLNPMKGTITGNLENGHGAKIEKDGSLEIKKIWSQQMLISESYTPISKKAYEVKLESYLPASPSQDIETNCR